MEKERRATMAILTVITEVYLSPFLNPAFSRMLKSTGHMRKRVVTWSRKATMKVVPRMVAVSTQGLPFTKERLMR